MDWINRLPLRLQCYIKCKLHDIQVPTFFEIHDKEEIIQYLIDNHDLVNNFTYVSKYATWEIIQANPDKNWNYYGLSFNPNITWDIVQANPDKNWDYMFILLRLLHS